MLWLESKLMSSTSSSDSSSDMKARANACTDPNAILHAYVISMALATQASKMFWFCAPSWALVVYASDNRSSYNY
eukprot:5181017-Amphidinium_carterae.1